MTEKNKNLEQTIVGAARRQFIERGYEKTSMSDIAAAAGINRTGLHYYFRTKEKMFQAVFGSIMESILPRIQIIFDENIPLIDKFGKLIDEYFNVFGANPALPRFIMGEVERDVDHLLDTGRNLNFDFYLIYAARAITGEMESGTIRTMPPEVIFMTFMSQLIFPFMAKNLVVSIFFDEDETAFREFLPLWKENILRQMKALLEP